MLLSICLAVALLAVGGFAWKQRQDRDARCEEAFYAVRDAVQAGGASEAQQKRLRTCMDEGWRLGG